MIKVNLVPAEILAKAQQKQQNLQIGLGVAAVLMLVALVSFWHWSRLQGLEKTYAVKDAEFKRLAAVVAKVNEIETTAAAVSARLKVINDLLKGRPAYPYFMSEFVRTVPPGVRVRSLNTTGGSASPIKLAISAESRSNEDIRVWVNNMEVNGKFGNVELGAVTTVEGLEKAYNFTMTTVYTPKL